MQIFIDSANPVEIEKWLAMGVIDGVTSNPTILLADGVYDLEAHIRKLAELVNPRPVSVEVTTNDLEKMLQQARTFSTWANNIVVKVPQINQDGVPCYGVINRLEREGTII